MLKTYDDMKIDFVRATIHPDILVKLGSDLTQKKVTSGKPATKQLIQYLVSANHTSLFEHASVTMLISGVSRSFLAQITRHRMASYTAASQHYQDYRDYDDIVHKNYVDRLEGVIGNTNISYELVVEDGVPPEEARQVLPNSKAVNILMTINARSLINLLNLRLCRRNVAEMQIFATRLHKECRNWWPRLFNLVGPDCYMWDNCRQGKMKAKECQRGLEWTMPTLTWR